MSKKVFLLLENGLAYLRSSSLFEPQMTVNIQLNFIGLVFYLLLRFLLRFCFSKLFQFVLNSFFLLSCPSSWSFLLHSINCGCQKHVSKVDGDRRRHLHLETVKTIQIVAWSSLDEGESLACMITSPLNNKLGCFLK